MSGIFSVTVSGDSYDELVKNFTSMWREMIDADEDEAPAAKPAKKAAAKAAAPVVDDDDDDLDDDLDDDDIDEDDDEDDEDEDDLEDYTEADLKAKGIKDLRTIADKEFELETEGLSKAQLIEAILEAQDEDSDDDDSDDEDEEEDDDDEGDDDGYTLDELNEMEVDELKEIADEEGVAYTPKTRKATLVKAIFEVAGVDEDDE